MPYSISGGPRSLLSPRQSHRHARCWWLRRTDNFNLYLTDHDHKLTLYDGAIYTPVGGLNATAVRKGSALEEQNFEATGVLSSEAITFDDLRAGLFREAEVNEYLVDWLYPWAGPLQHARYWITETKFDGEKWTAQVSGIPYWLRFAVGHVYSRNCDADFGDARCGFDATTVATAVAAIDTIPENRIEFTVSAPFAGSVTGTYDDAVCVFLTGANANLRTRVRTYTVASRGYMRLYLKTPNTMAAGDTFYLVKDCNKTKAACIAYSNVVNFRGEESIPGTDKTIETPTS